MKSRLVILLLCLVAAASAQLYPTKLAMIQEASFRLSDPSIRYELRITDSQTKDIADIMGKHSEDQQEISEKLSKAKPEEYESIQTEMDRLERATSDKLIACLTLTQKKRLKQICWQNNGAFAMRDAAVAKEVGLKPEQRAKIEAICKSTEKSMDEVNAKMADEIVAVPDSAGKAGDAKKSAIVKKYTPKLDSLEAAAKKDILAVLSPAQTKKWQAMLGKPFKD